MTDSSPEIPTAAQAPAPSPTPSAAPATAATAAVPAGAGEVRIGTVGPMSGRLAPFGEQFVLGVEQAVGDLNASGGVLGQAVRLQLNDDACDAAAARRAAENLAGRRVVVVIGHFCSDASIAAADVYQDKGVIMISPASTDSALTGRGLSNVFRVVPPDSAHADLIALFVTERYKGGRVAVVSDNSQPRLELAQALAESFRRNGVVPILFERIDRTAADFSQVVARIAETRADAVVYAGHYRGAAGLAREMRARGLTAQLIGTNTLVWKEYWEAAGPASDGTLFTYYADAASNPAAKDLAARLRAAGRDPARYTLNSYAAVQAWAQAVRRAGSTDAAAVREALKAGEFETVIGPLAFDAQGDPRQSPLILYEWRNGQIVPHWSPQRPTS